MGACAPPAAAHALQREDLDSPAGPAAAYLPVVVPSSLLGRALAYMQGQWPKLVRFVQNGAWPISNNLCENAIRPWVVGRKGWLFADTVAGAHARANLYSLIETARANGIEP